MLDWRNDPAICTGYVFDGSYTVITDKDDKSKMLMDVTLNWKDVPVKPDPSKNLRFGWMIETDDDEYRSEKVSYWHFEAWPADTDPVPQPNAWQWQLLQAQELCVIGGFNKCFDDSSKSD